MERRLKAARRQPAPRRSPPRLPVLGPHKFRGKEAIRGLFGSDACRNALLLHPQQAPGHARPGRRRRRRPSSSQFGAARAPPGPLRCEAVPQEESLGSTARGWGWLPPPPLPPPLLLLSGVKPRQALQRSALPSPSHLSPRGAETRGSTYPGWPGW